MKKSYATPILWAGSDQAFEVYCSAEAYAMENPVPPHLAATSPTAGGTVIGHEASESPAGTPYSRLLQVQDGIGIISIKGVLTNTDHWANEYRGLVSYNEVRTAFYLALLDAVVKEILMDVASPGGAVHGLLDAVEAVAQAGKAKRITAYTDSVAHSAMMWLIAPAKKRYASPIASVGSIGVVTKHVEYSKMAAMEGVTQTIIRSGPWKQLVNDVEPLSAKAEAELQSQVDHLNQVFEESVAEHLKTTSAIVHNKMGQGREFIGSQAVEAGLIAATSSFDEVYSTIRNRVAKAGGMTPQGGIDMQKKYVMSAATALAAAAAGINPAEDAVPVAEGEASSATGTTPEATGGGGASATTSGEEGVTTEAPATAATSPAAPEAESAVVLMLKSQLTEKDETIFGLKTEVLALKAATEGVDQLKKIVAQTLDTMAISMAGSATPGLADLPTSALLAQFEATSTKFSTWWAGVTPGGTAVTAATDTAPAATPPLSRIDAARVAASKIQTK